MKRLVLVAAAATITAFSSASEPVVPALSCVQNDSCGCSIVLENAICPSGSVHFFHELSDGSPLLFNPAQGPVTATSLRAQSGMFTPGPGDSWSDVYRYSGGNVQIHYTPGTGKCPKLEQGEPCEYFDVRANVLLSSPQGVYRYSGVGRCGC